ncbi:AtpZ/AtpI family protein [Methylosinus sp. Sm6]|uniref:AtpZ/AtpI family protein n=1 Tax=Methylosinus sp. Sm6 TaxID=2866948 RepID=UPI001C9A08D5|nr:AtpZ/AtpI family protein [Methylosinus sp. Sm6]MBY6243651.1 AtpZ/AtpI family protein [Methylosinus sp. Sm6]
MRDAGKNASDAELRARLEQLQAALRKQEEDRLEQANAGSSLPIGGSFGRAMSVGFTVLSEFVSAILVGMLIGWQADAWLGTKPWLLVLFLGLGVAAGFWNVFRLSASKEAEDGG